MGVGHPANVKHNKTAVFERWGGAYCQALCHARAIEAGAGVFEGYRVHANGVGEHAREHHVHARISLQGFAHRLCHMGRGQALRYTP